ncbi:DNA alkylation repair protein [Saccharibacillus sp. CPCC 101409]|uniref:DNA alkylation repair protein n=1 Tax=Saccharibacillus sp. CPCC 101409 TaxID=3058041 RepID=UPI0026720B98|nr:DNA alkylation repair protein [Saccharibacillus sp. CPCC 101409]MDO3409553.1 DNA alkylation repair protein [Saccharibacillus sp. CPCC 101409]
MPEPLKNIYTEAFLTGFAAKLRAVHPPFPAERFALLVMDDGWDRLELKGRIRRISQTLGVLLPGDFGEALRILQRLDATCMGFPYLFLPDFVETHGLTEADFDRSLDALERFTSGSSSEFAIRAFLLHSPERTLLRIKEWARSGSEHVRRLSSEGCRPRLPWGQSLPLFKRDPGPVVEILELLKADPSLYVRKSVANNLNDISKDHPALVAELARRWYGDNPSTDWIVRRGCRGLVRRSDPAVLALFGYAEHADAQDEPLVQSASLTVSPSSVSIGGQAELLYRIVLRDGEPRRIRIEYAVDFVKASGRASRKTFLLSDRIGNDGRAPAGKRVHKFADLTTRRHYAGPHRIVLLVNGVEAAETTLILVPRLTSSSS